MKPGFAPVDVVIGPTASGKSARAIELAEDGGGVVINADSLQLYDDLPLLTAQPGAADKARVPHALYGVWPPAQVMDAARWRALALDEIARAAAAGRRAVVAGGTGFYINALLYGLSPMPPVPDDIRAAARARHKDMGADAFFADLQRRDPYMPARLKPADTQRVVRAAEVLDATGKSLSYWQSLPREGPPAGMTFRVHRVDPGKAELAARIRARLAQMVDAGALDEVRGVCDRIAQGQLNADAPVTNALGFHPFRRHLAGDVSFDDAFERTVLDTQHYAKRQRTWIRGQLRETDQVFFFPMDK